MSDGLKFLSSVIATGSASSLSEIDSEMLLDNEHTAYEFIRTHHRTYRDLPSAQTVQEETGIRLPAASESMRYYIDKLTDRHSYNLVRDRFPAFREGLAQMDMDAVADSVSSMQQALRNRAGGSRAGQAIQIDEGMRLVADRLDGIKGTGGISGILTGWPQFDAITGGYQDADLITWVSRMGMGKTYLALYQADQAHLAGENVLFVTTEMGAEQIARRVAALRLGVNPLLLKNGNISTHIQRRVRSLCTDMVGADRYRIFSVGMNAKVGAIAGLCEEFGPSIVFIDGVYLLRPTEGGKNQNRTERITSVYDELKGTTLDTNLPIVCMSQLNRMAGKGGKEGSLETIGYSDAIGTHSSVVVGLKEGPTENPKASRGLEFFKGREGEAGEVAINFKFAPLDMSEMTVTQLDREGGTGSTSVSWMGPNTTTTGGDNE